MTSNTETMHPAWMKGTHRWCWINGEIVETKLASVSILDRGFLYGDGLFETVRIQQGKPFQWALHAARLSEGCRALGIPVAESGETWANRLNDLIEKNQSAQALARIHLSRGPGPRGYAPSPSPAPTSIITLHHAPALPPNEPQSWNLFLSKYRAPSFHAISKWKTSNKLFQIMVKKEALEAGFDDAILLNEQNQLTETSSANLFLIHNNQIQTPTTECGILNGTTRQLMIELASSLGFTCMESPCGQEMLDRADAAFATLCSYGLVRINRIGNKTLPTHPMVTSLYRAYLNRLKAD